ncbi:hypothetical protein FTX61_20170 [Nitriliruptoraceae bacterium ZYF776]|nr:hypothetical protein [Profundirhabdus halotolerans]
MCCARRSRGRWRRRIRPRQPDRTSLPVKVIGRLLGERSSSSLVWAARPRDRLAWGDNTPRRRKAAGLASLRAELDERQRSRHGVTVSNQDETAATIGSEDGRDQSARPGRLVCRRHRAPCRAGLASSVSSTN